MLIAKAIRTKRHLQKDILCDLAICSRQAVRMVCVSQHAHVPIPRSSSKFFVCYALMGNMKSDRATQQTAIRLKQSFKQQKDLYSVMMYVSGGVISLQGTLLGLR